MIPLVVMASTIVTSSPQVSAALIAVSGVLVGLIARDVLMALYLLRRKREHEVADSIDKLAREHRDLVRLYADPLLDSVTSLKYRLQEILHQKQAGYLLADAPNIPFFEYKRVSALYRIACVLGWIRAVRRERSYIDPLQASASVEMEAIGELEKALADGAHVEMQRLEELAALWSVPHVMLGAKAQVASLIDIAWSEYLSRKRVLGSRDLPDSEQFELADQCAEVFRRMARVDVPSHLVRATTGEAVITLGIREAYIYRDWQAAIGDLMIVEAATGCRHYTVQGFGAFEEMYLDARSDKDSSNSRWMNRLEALIHDIDISNENVFDSRRELLKKVYACCEKLEAGLQGRISG